MNSATQANQAATAGISESPEEELQRLRAKLLETETANAELRRINAEKQLVDQHKNTANESHASGKERFAIAIDEARNDNEIDPVQVQINGRLYLIKRGNIVEVPMEVIGVLNTAVEDRAIPKVDAQGNPNGYDVRRARRFPFQNFGKTVNADGTRTDLQLPALSTAEV